MKDKMLAGELYLPDDPDLVADKERCSRLVQQYNATNVTEADLRAQLLEQLGDLCCLDQWQIGVPNAAPLVVVPARPVAEFRELSHGEVLRLMSCGGFSVGAEPFLA